MTHRVIDSSELAPLRETARRLARLFPMSYAADCLLTHGASWDQCALGIIAFLGSFEAMAAHHRSRRHRRALLVASATFAAMALTAVACSSTDDARPHPDAGNPVSRTNDDGGTNDGATPESATEIVLPESATFAKRSCTVTLRYDGAASSVEVGGEFTSWATAPLPMTKNGSSFVLTLGAEQGLTAGQMYAYKLIVDGVWGFDPNGTHRKLVDTTMNSAFVVPKCKGGPELTAGQLTASASGDAKVRVTVLSASDDARPQKVVARLDHAEVAASTFAVDESAGAIDFSFTGLAKGKHTLSLVAVDAQSRSSLPIDLPFWIEDEAFSYRDGLLYMFMVDRYANGNASNDAPVGAPVEYDADFHGGDLEGALAVLKTGYFEKLGVRTIWLSPLNRQTSKYEVGDGNQLFSGYHGYWPVRAREVEPRFGGDAALRAFIEEAHRRGHRVLLDLINNQVHQDHEYVSPHGDWFRTSCKCGDNGCGWSERPFDCMFQPYLPDINWTNDGAATQFVDDAVSWISGFDFDGFRVDAVKHVESNSIWNLRAELTRRFEQGGARIFMVGETAVGQGDHGTFFGETFDDGYAWVDAYAGKYALDGQFDFPTRHNMADGLVDGTKPLSDVEGALHYAETRYKPTSQHVRFLNGHDNPRIASIAARDPKLGCTWASGCRGDQLPPSTYTDPVVFQRLRRALTVLYTLPGVPYLYAGDEVAFGGGSDPDMRRDMRFAEAALSGVQMHAPGAQGVELSDQQLALLEYARKLGSARAGSRALRRGSRVTLLGSEADLWVYGYVAGDELAIVVVNRGDAVTARAISTSNASLPAKTLALAAGTGTAVLNGATLTVSLPAGEAAIFVGK